MAFLKLSSCTFRRRMLLQESLYRSGDRACVRLVRSVTANNGPEEQQQRRNNCVAAVQSTDTARVVDGKPKWDPLDTTFSDAKATFKSKTTGEILRAYIVYTLCSSNYLVENNMQVSGKRSNHGLLSSSHSPSIPTTKSLHSHFIRSPTFSSLTPAPPIRPTSYQSLLRHYTSFSFFLFPSFSQHRYIPFNNLAVPVSSLLKPCPSGKSFQSILSHFGFSNHSTHPPKHSHLYYTHPLFHLLIYCPTY